MLPFWLWCEISRRRPTVMLVDGSECTLIGVRRHSHLMKVKRFSRHVVVEYDSVHGLITPTAELVRPSSWRLPLVKPSSSQPLQLVEREKLPPVYQPVSEAETMRLFSIPVRSPEGIRAYVSKSQDHSSA